MLFTDFLKSTVMLLAAEATALAAIALFAGAQEYDDIVLIEILGFIVVGGVAGAIVGRRSHASTGISELLANAKSETNLPPQEPGAVMFNRLWPLAVYALAFTGVSFFYPQATGIGAAFLIFLALTWRKQERAVTAIEERDGARFYVQRSSPFRSIELVRATGLRRLTAVDGGR